MSSVNENLIQTTDNYTRVSSTPASGACGTVCILCLVFTKDP